MTSWPGKCQKTAGKMPKKKTRGNSIDKRAQRDKLRRQNETDVEHAHRCETLSAAQAKRLAVESDGQRTQRITKISSAQTARLAWETDDQRTQRLAAAGNYQHQKLR